jgi:hypothetical protein
VLPRGWGVRFPGNVGDPAIPPAFHDARVLSELESTELPQSFPRWTRTFRLRVLVGEIAALRVEGELERGLGEEGGSWTEGPRVLGEQFVVSALSSSHRQGSKALLPVALDADVDEL